MSLRSLLDEAERVVAPSLSACVLQDGAVIFAHNPARIYDLASITKVLATTELSMRWAASGLLSLDGPHPLWQPGVTARRLLQHSAGCLWWRDLGLVATGRAAILDAALREPLVTPPGTTHTYSDIGFLSLGAALEAIGCARLDALLQRDCPDTAAALSWGHPNAEPTEGGLRGVVHDDNARNMGGVAPHAGLFGTAEAVARVAARWIDGGVPGAREAFSSRGAGSHALGWDTPSGEMSSAGAAPPEDAVGHTGFTGTSVWMSPARGRVAVLLTNRVVYGRDPAKIRNLRHAWHQDAWSYRADGLTPEPSAR